MANMQGKSVKGSEFAGMLSGGDFRGSEHTIVKGDVLLDGKDERFAKELSKSLHLCGVTFSGAFMIRNCSMKCLSLQECLFLEGLDFTDLDVQHSSLHHCEVGGALEFHRCKFVRISIEVLKIAHSVSLAGLCVSERFSWGCNEAASGGPLPVELLSQRVDEIFSAPVVSTDDPVFATQLHMLGIPVAVSSQMAKGMLSLAGKDKAFAIS